MDPGFTSIQDTMVNKTDYVDLGLACADVCRALRRGMNGKRTRDLSPPVHEAITQLTTWVKLVTHISDDFLTDSLNRRTIAEIQEKVSEKGRRNIPSRLVHVKSDKDLIAHWKSDLDRILRVFTVCSLVFRFTATNCCYSGRVGLKHSYDGFGSPSWRADGSGRYRRPTSFSECDFSSTDIRMLTVP